MKGWIRNFFLISILAAGPVAVADATTIFVDAEINHEVNPVVLSLGAGDYTVNASGAWWSGLSWSNKYNLASSQFSEYSVGTGGHSTRAEAEAAAVGTSFSLSVPADVQFFIRDSKHSDNTRGMTLDVSTRTLHVLAPGLGSRRPGRIRQQVEEDVACRSPSLLKARLARITHCVRPTSSGRPDTASPRTLRTANG